MESKSTILLSKETRSRLLKEGKKNQTYDEIIQELLEYKYKKGHLKRNTHNITSSDISSQ
jgi:hypothetical protein